MRTTRRMTIGLMTTAGALGLGIAPAAAEPPTRDNGGIFWPAPTCEIAVTNSTGEALEVSMHTDQNLYPGTIVTDDLATYEGQWRRGKLLNRIRHMDASGFADRVEPGETVGLAAPCGLTRFIEDGGTWVLIHALGLESQRARFLDPTRTQPDARSSDNDKLFVVRTLPDTW